MMSYQYPVKSTYKVDSEEKILILQFVILIKENTDFASFESHFI